MSFFTKPTYPKARKRYFCDWCGQEIKVGEKYFYQFQFPDAVSLRLHTECASAMYREDFEEGEIIGCGHPRGLTEYEWEELEKVPETTATEGEA